MPKVRKINKKVKYPFPTPTNTRIKAVRDALHLTQAQCAGLIGVSAPRWCCFEKDMLVRYSLKMQPQMWELFLLKALSMGLSLPPKEACLLDKRWDFFKCEKALNFTMRHVSPNDFEEEE